MAKDNTSGGSAIPLSADTLLPRFMSRIDDFRCPVCHNLVRTYPFRCVNQHVRCRECRGSLTECPVCHEEFSGKRPLTVFPKKCSHEDCEVMVRYGDDHEKYCGFRKTECKKCDLTVPGKDIFDHMKRRHPNIIIFPAKNYSIETPVAPDKSLVFFTPFIVVDYFIWVKAEYKPEDKKFNHTCYIVPNEKPTDNINFKIVFPPENAKYMYCTKLNTDPDVDSPDENTIHVPWKPVADYIASNGRLKVGVYFSAIKGNN